MRYLPALLLFAACTSASPLCFKDTDCAAGRICGATGRCEDRGAGAPDMGRGRDLGEPSTCTSSVQCYGDRLCVEGQCGEPVDMAAPARDLAEAPVDMARSPDLMLAPPDLVDVSNVCPVSGNSLQGTPGDACSSYSQCCGGTIDFQNCQHGVCCRFLHFETTAIRRTDPVCSISNCGGVNCYDATYCTATDPGLANLHPCP
jgi:hypothetical protein